MAAIDILRGRAQRRTATAQVDCGALGLLSVEALPLRECEALCRGADPNRALLYAACRELQTAGERLRQEGSLFAPDEIMQYLSEQEARSGAEAVLELSGWTNAAGQNTKTDVSEEEIRLLSVQKSENQFNEIRQEFVQSPAGQGTLRRAAPEEIRLLSVQSFEEAVPEYGQVSHESADKAEKVSDWETGSGKTQFLGDLSENAAQIVGTPSAYDPQAQRGAALGGQALHETKSESGEAVHEIESEFFGRGSSTLHEITSDSGRGLHESKSDFGEDDSGVQKKTAGRLHETRSESAETLHEIKSELAELAARALAEALLRASAVR